MKIKQYKELAKVNELVSYDEVQKALSTLGYHSTGFGGIWTNGVCKIQIDIKSEGVIIKSA